jgi:hypothetical protein
MGRRRRRRRRVLLLFAEVVVFFFCRVKQEKSIHTIEMSSL